MPRRAAPMFSEGLTDSRGQRLAHCGGTKAPPYGGIALVAPARLAQLSSPTANAVPPPRWGVLFVSLPYESSRGIGSRLAAGDKPPPYGGIG